MGISVGVIGAGYWGKNIVRNLARQKGWTDEQLGQFLSPFGLKL